MADPFYQDMPPPPLPPLEFLGNLAVLAYSDFQSFVKIISPYVELPVCDARSEEILSNLTDRLNFHTFLCWQNGAQVRFTVLSAVMANERIPEEDKKVAIEDLIALGARPDGGDAWSRLPRNPLSMAVENVDVKLVQLFLEAGVTRVGAAPRPELTIDMPNLKPHIRVTAMIDDYAEGKRSNISELLIDGKHDALYGRMRSGMVKQVEFYRPVNGKCFLEWASIYDNFPGFPEMIYRFGVDLPMVRYPISRPERLRKQDMVFSMKVVTDGLERLERRVETYEDTISSVEINIAMNASKLEYLSGEPFVFGEGCSSRESQGGANHSKRGKEDGDRDEVERRDIEGAKNILKRKNETGDWDEADVSKMPRKLAEFEKLLNKVSFLDDPSDEEAVFSDDSFEDGYEDEVTAEERDLVYGEESTSSCPSSGMQFITDDEDNADLHDVVQITAPQHGVLASPAHPGPAAFSIVAVKDNGEHVKMEKVGDEWIWDEVGGRNEPMEMVKEAQEKNDDEQDEKLTVGQEVQR